MKILLVNANTTQRVTEIMHREARSIASTGVVITAVTARFGSRIIGTRGEAAIATHAALEQAARHYAGHDAVVFAVSLDCGVAAAREVLPIPVVGMMEAALLTACMLGGRFGLVTVGRRCVPLYQELTALYGLSGRLAGIAAIDDPMLQIYENPRVAEDIVATEVSRLVEDTDAEVVIMAGAIFTGMWRDIQQRVRVPLLDGIACAIRQAELLANLGVPKPNTGSYAPPPKKELIDVDAAIIRLFDSET